MNCCRLCYSTDVTPRDLPPEAGRWVRCSACGSDSNLMRYDAAPYHSEFSLVHLANIGGIEVAREQVKGNCAWFGHYADPALDRTFLDVGCADGSALDVMASLGWSVHGFDLAPPHYHGPHVTVGPVFHRHLFPIRYAAVLCREVLEHVESPDFLLHELHGACLPGGLVQVQTPCPTGAYDPGIYQSHHQFVPSPEQLRRMLAAACLDPVDSMLWGDRQPGQAYLCRAKP